MIYFIALQDRDQNETLGVLWQDFADGFLSNFTTHDGRTGAIFDVDLDDYEVVEEFDTYPIGEDGIVGLRLLPAEEPGEVGGAIDDDPFEEDAGNDNDYTLDAIDPPEPTIQVERIEPDGEALVAGRYTVRQNSWAGISPDGESHYHIFRPAFQEFAKSMERNVTVDVPHGVHSTLHEDERFWVNIWSSPDRTAARDVIPPDRLFGNPNLCTDAGFQPVRDVETQLIDTLHEGDYVVAQLFDNDLFIHHDVVHWGHESEVAILGHILNWAVTAYNITPEEREARIEARRQEVAQRARNAYIEWAKDRDRQALTSAETLFERTRGQAQRYHSQLVEILREQHRLQEQVAALRTAETDPAKYGQEYDKLIQHPKISGIDFDPIAGLFKVNTRTLYAYSEDNGTWHEMGEYVISIRNDGEIRFYNQTNRVDGHGDRMHHPHVFSDGNACMGNFTEITADLVAQHEYGTLFTMAIAFLETANEEDSAGRHLYKWPVVEESVATARPERDLAEVIP